MSARVISSLFLLAFPVLIACGGSSTERDSRAPTDPPAVPRAAPGASASAPDRARVVDDTPRIIFLGDSLTAGLGLDSTLSYPSLIQARLKREGFPHTVVNAGVSGDTSAGGLRRLEWALADGNPRVLIVALGGNDGLRGLQPEQLMQNLAAIIEKGRARGLSIILAGMEAPPNFGSDYTSRFRNVYPALAEKYDVTLIPFLLAGVAGMASLNQNDGIHPNERGAQIVADLVWRALEPELTLNATAK